jgi:hypothetical protein
VWTNYPFDGFQPVNGRESEGGKLILPSVVRCKAGVLLMRTATSAPLMAEDYSGPSWLKRIATLPHGKQGKYTLEQVQNAERL